MQNSSCFSASKDCSKNSASTARCLLHELGEHGTDRPEDLGHLRREHVRLEVVEERRVRRVLPLEAVDVLPLELEVALERGQELCEVVRGAGLDPDLVAERSGARQLDAELRRNAALLLPVAARHANEAGVVGLVVERLLERTQALEQAAQLLVHEPLVYHLAQRRELVGTGGIAAVGHGDLLIPCEHHSRSAEIGDLGQSFLQSAKVGLHRGRLYRRR